MKYSEGLIEECQAYAKEKLNRTISEETAERYLDSYADLYNWFTDSIRQSQQWEKKLKEHPEGFHLTNGTYSCTICGDSITGETSWHDQYGHSCIPCRDARRKRIIPVIAYKNPDSWYRMFEFESNWHIKPSTVKKFIKKGKLKARIVRSSKGWPHCYLFMIKDNKGFLPQKPKSFHVRTGESSYKVEYEQTKSPFE